MMNYFYLCFLLILPCSGICQIQPTPKSYHKIKFLYQKKSTLRLDDKGLYADTLQLKKMFPDIEYEKIKDALNRALQNPNKKQEIWEMYNEKITIEFDGKQFYAQIWSDNQIGLTQITHSSTEIIFPEGYLNTELKDAIEWKIQYYNNLKSSK